MSEVQAPTQENPPAEIAAEQEIWQPILGARVEVKPIPSSVTPEVRKRLEALGMDLVYIPGLDMGSLVDLQTMGVERFLDGLQERYPNWKPYESMDHKDQMNPAQPRNVDQLFWNSVRGNDIEFPELLGQWIAIEKMPKPLQREQYESTRLGEILDIDRFDVSWDDIQGAIARKKDVILGEIGLENADVKLPEALEWNLLANRYGWGATRTFERTSTESRNPLGRPQHVIIGSSSNGGAGKTGLDDPDFRGMMIGFRLGVYPGS